MGFGIMKNTDFNQHTCAYCVLCAHQRCRMTKIYADKCLMLLRFSNFYLAFSAKRRTVCTWKKKYTLGYFKKRVFIMELIL